MRINYSSYRRLKRSIKYMNFTKKEAQYVFKKEVQENEDFKRHILETSQKLGIDAEIVELVVSHYFLTNLLKLKAKTERIRIVILGFFYLEHINPLRNEFSNYYKLYKRDQETFKQKYFNKNGKLHTNPNDSASTRK